MSEDTPICRVCGAELQGRDVYEGVCKSCREEAVLGDTKLPKKPKSPTRQAEPPRAAAEPAAHAIALEADVDVEAGAGEALEDSSASFRMVSVQSVTAFFMMFGLVGLTLRKEADWDEALAIIGAMVAGVASFWFIAKVIALMRRLQSSGNIRLANAIGQEGSTYLTIPAGGVGKVQVVVQGRLRHVSAVARDGQAIPTGEQVTVVGMAADNTLVVERARGEG